MWRFRLNADARCLLINAQQLREKLFQRSLDPLQEAFTQINPGMLTKKELRKYVLLAGKLCDVRSDVQRTELTSFLDELYARLHPKKATDSSFPIFERVVIRFMLIGVLFLLISGFTEHSYYSIARFGVLFGGVLLFFQECRKRAYWTIVITCIVICAYNPLYKAHFIREQWIDIDEELIALLLAAIFVDLLVWWFKWKRVRLDLKRLLSRAQQKIAKLFCAIIGVKIPRPGIAHSWILATVLLFIVIAVTVWNSIKNNGYYADKITDTVKAQPQTGNLDVPKVSESSDPSKTTYSSSARDIYADWDKIKYKTGAHPSNMVYRPKYSNLDNKLRIIMVGDDDAVVKLFDNTTNECVRYVYIKSGDTFNIRHIPLGTYYIKIAYGNDWRQKEIDGKIIGRFTQNPLYKRGDQELVFYTNGKEINWYELRLKVNNAENAFKSHTISEGDFNN